MDSIENTVRAPVRTVLFWCAFRVQVPAIGAARLQSVVPEAAPASGRASRSLDLPCGIPPAGSASAVRPACHWLPRRAACEEAAKVRRSHNALWVGIRRDKSHLSQRSFDRPSDFAAYHAPARTAE